MILPAPDNYERPQLLESLSEELHLLSENDFADVFELCYAELCRRAHTRSLEEVKK